MELQVIFLLGTSPVGRRKLAQELGSTEMKTRSLLKEMQKKGFVQFEKQGCVLTARGKREHTKISSLIAEFKQLNFGRDALDTACVGAGLKKNPGLPAWEVRDLAVRGGATGAFVLSKNKTWHLDGMRKSFALDLHGDYAVVCFAPTRAQASHALWAVLNKLL